MNINLLVKLYAHDGIPPNIKVVKVPVDRDWEGKLRCTPCYSLVEYAQNPPPPWKKREEEIPSSYQEEAVQLEMIEYAGTQYMAGFSERAQMLFIGFE